MTRERPDLRRGAEIRDFHYRDRRWTLAVGRYADGRPSEVFVSCPDGGEVSTSETASAMRDVGIIVSMALQHGVPAEVMRQGVSRLDDGEPASITGRVLDELCKEGGES